MEGWRGGGVGVGGGVEAEAEAEARGGSGRGGGQGEDENGWRREVGVRWGRTGCSGSCSPLAQCSNTTTSRPSKSMAFSRDHPCGSAAASASSAIQSSSASRGRATRSSPSSAAIVCTSELCSHRPGRAARGRWREARSLPPPPPLPPRYMAAMSAPRSGSPRPVLLSASCCCSCCSSEPTLRSFIGTERERRALNCSRASAASLPPSGCPLARSRSSLAMST